MVAAKVNRVPQSSRDRILERIRKAKANTDTLASERSIPRAYDRASSQQAEDTLALFEERLRDYDAGVFKVGRHEVAHKAAECLGAANRRRIAIPTGLPPEWLLAGFFLLTVLSPAGP